MSTQTDIEALNKQLVAYKNLVTSLESQLSHHREQRGVYQEAVNTLQSERDANSRLTAEIESLRSQNAELRKAQEWQPIETAPMHKPVLLSWRHALEPLRGQYIDDERGEGWMCEGDRCMPVNQEDCTHWMPLPAAPHQEVKEQG